MRIPESESTQSRGSRHRPFSDDSATCQAPIFLGACPQVLRHVRRTLNLSLNQKALVLSPRGSPSQKLLLLPAPLPCRAEAPLLFLRQTESGCGSPEAGKAGRVGWRGLGGSGKARFPDEEASGARLPSVRASWSLIPGCAQSRARGKLCKCLTRVICS